MVTSIIKHAINGEDRYLLWESIVDAPVSFGLTLEEIKLLWEDKYQRGRGYQDFESRLLRQGGPHSIEDVLDLNRAGARETCLSIEQIVDYFFVRRGDGAKPVGKTMAELDAEEENARATATPNEENNA